MRNKKRKVPRSFHDYIAGGGEKNFTIQPEEWDFSGCPKNERMQCCLYEYARSSPAFRTDYEQQRTSAGEGFANLGSSGFGLSLNCPEFPTTPWLKIGAAIRKKRVKRLFRPRDPGFTIAYPQQTPRFNEATGEEVCLVEICWGCSETEIFEDFKNWVKANHPAKQSRITGDNSIWPERLIKTAISMLNNLGAWRLLQQMTHMEAWLLTSDHLKNHKPLFNTQQSWSRAKQRAEAFLGLKPE